MQLPICAVVGRVCILADWLGMPVKERSK